MVRVSWDNVNAYAKWAGKELPTEAQWEFAARGGLKQKVHCWGNEKVPDRKWLANIWQGKFPLANSGKNGFTGTAPAQSYPANGYGLYDMSGNVWEWYRDWYLPDYYEKSPKMNPTGPKKSHDPQGPGVPKRVMRGGSFLCNDSYCSGYRPSSCMKTSPDTGLAHAGFRCVINSSEAKPKSKQP